MKNLNIKPRFVTDYRGRKVSVMLSLPEYNKILEELEELNDLRLYDEVKARKEKKVALTDYIKSRKK